jgi:hypothetical protein
VIFKQKHFNRKSAETTIWIVAESKNVYDLVELLYDGSISIERERLKPLIELSKFLGISFTVNENSKRDSDDNGGDYDESLIPEVSMAVSETSSVGKSKQFEEMTEQQQQNEFLTRFRLIRNSKDKEEEDSKMNISEDVNQMFSYFLNAQGHEKNGVQQSQVDGSQTMPKSNNAAWLADNRERCLRRTLPISYKDMQSPPKLPRPIVQKCKHCSNFFRNIYIHQKNCSANPKRVKFTCVYCGAAFTRKENVVRHQQMSCTRRPPHTQ